MENIKYLLLGSFIFSSTFANATDQTPNIVFVLADDMGIGDLGCYGQKNIQTPNIDSLADKGILFTQHYSGSAVSAPSRCSLMTGKDMGHAYIRGNMGTADGFDIPLAASEITVAEILKKQGYSTACVGKWGLGGPNTEGHPNNQGFDYFFGYLSQKAAHNYYPDYLYENSDTVDLSGREYSHFKIMEKGLDYIRQHSTEPFFVYFALTLPHTKLNYPDISEYKDCIKNIPEATYASMVSEIDRSVGQIVDLLEHLGIMHNTIFIFSSDNGVHDKGGHDPEFFDSNGIFRGNKRDLYEGGVRTPFIVRWDGKIEAGTKSSHISAFWDFFPTVCEIVGSKELDAINGISYLPMLLSNGFQEEHEYIYYEFFEEGGKQSIRVADWKLIRLNISSGNVIEELYNLNIDIAETENLIDTYPKVADSLRTLLDSDSIRVGNPIFTW